MKGWICFLISRIRFLVGRIPIFWKVGSRILKVRIRDLVIVGTGLFEGSDCFSGGLDPVFLEGRIRFFWSVGSGFSRWADTFFWIRRVR